MLRKDLPRIIFDRPRKVPNVGNPRFVSSAIEGLLVKLKPFQLLRWYLWPEL